MYTREENKDDNMFSTFSTLNWKQKDGHYFCPDVPNLKGPILARPLVHLFHREGFF